MENLIHFSDTSLSDMFKDANNFRPRHYKEWWTPSELEEEYNYLQAQIERVMAEERAAEESALVEFNKLVEDTIALGAGDRETAIKWLMDAENVDTSYLQDVEHFFWSYGLSYELYRKLAVDFTKKGIV
jgi:hypothetical protein